MGCGEDKISTEENAFATHLEAGLWKRPMSCAQVEAAFYKAMREGSLSKDRTLKLVNSLTFQVSGELLTAFESSPDSVDVKKLFRYALLLCVGNVLEKGGALWDLQDESGSEEMTRTQVEGFIGELAASAVEYIQPLVGNQPDIGKERINTWLGIVKTKKRKFAQDMANLYLNGAEILTKNQFLAVLRENAQANLTNPTIIRSRLEEIKVVPQKFAGAFAAKPSSTPV